MKKTSCYIILSSLLILSSCINKGKLPDLRETYSYKDTKPFGTFVAKNAISAAYPGKEILIRKKAFSKTYDQFADTHALYISISRNLFVDEEDSQAMLDYVYAGNTIFISASNIDTIFLNALLAEQVKADILVDLTGMKYIVTGVKIDQSLSQDTGYFSYYYKPFVNFFSSINAANTKVLSYNQRNKPNSFILFWGKGRLILHCDPRAFSNYFLLKEKNFLYLQSLLLVTGRTTGTVYWDDFYRNQNVRKTGEGNFSTFTEIMKYPPLAIAFWIFILLLALYVLFNSKRRQRIIPVIKKNENSSIAFTETIARLYLQHHDNKNIADKMITYFNESIRKSYFLNAGTHDNEFISVLSRKSGVPFEQTEQLFAFMKEISDRENVTDQQLLVLNDHIQKFYKNRN